MHTQQTESISTQSEPELAPQNLPQHVQSLKSDLEKAQKEQIALKRELQHRVKNNMQVVESLLAMSANQLQTPDAKRIFAKCRKRIATMALIYQTLCETNALSNIDLAAFVQTLSLSLSRQSSLQTQITTDTNQIALTWDADRCVDLGLILAELIANADEHAFNSQPRPAVQIQLIQPSKDQLQITVTDNGSGLPPNALSEQESKLGLKLVRNIVERNFNGQIQVQNDHGTQITMNIPQIAGVI